MTVRMTTLARHNAMLMLREPGPMISRLVQPLVLIALMRPLYLAALARDGAQAGTIQVVTGSRALIASTMCRAATHRTSRSLHGESAAKWSRRWCAASHLVWSPLAAAAIGSALLRSRSLSRPCA